MSYIGTPILIGDMRNVVVYVNPSGAKAFGKKAPEIVGKDILNLFSAMNRTHLHTAMENVKKGGHERVDIEEGGGFFKATLSPVTGEGGKTIGFIMSLLDLTREKKLEQSRMDVTARILSDIRGPLRVIRESLQSIKQTPCSRQCKETLDRADEETRAADRLINELLGLSAPAPEKMAVKQELDIVRSLRMAVTSMEPVLKQSGITIENLLPHELPHIVGDGDKLSQAIINLLNVSAHRERREGAAGDTLTVSGKLIRQRDGKEYVLLTVSTPWDGGSDASQDGDIAFIVQVIKAHSGTFTVAGEKGIGTTYSIVLPAVIKRR